MTAALRLFLLLLDPPPPHPHICRSVLGNHRPKGRFKLQLSTERFERKENLWPRALTGIRKQSGLCPCPVHGSKKVPGKLC